MPAQAISGIRTVQALSGEERENQRYSTKLGEALATGLRKARINGIGFGIVMGSFIGTVVVFANYHAFPFFWSGRSSRDQSAAMCDILKSSSPLQPVLTALPVQYALGLWFGSWLIINNKYNTSTGKSFSGGDVIMCFFAVVMGSFSIGQVMPAFQAFTKGQASAGRIWDVIERKPPIDVRDESGQKPSDVRGEIELRNVAFTYPARPDAPIFSNLSIKVAAGTEVALVGASGSGKSTIIQLMYRFYDPDSGQVTPNPPHALCRPNL